MPQTSSHGLVVHGQTRLPGVSPRRQVGAPAPGHEVAAATAQPARPQRATVPSSRARSIGLVT